MEEIRSGNRIYICETTNVVPDIKEVINSSNKCSLFINSVTLNPKNRNAELYSQFNKDTFHSFIYAFAIQIGKLSYSSISASQFEMNARRVERLCKRRGICLSDMEQKVIHFCKIFSSLKCYKSDRFHFSNQLKAELTKLYL